MDPCGPDAGRGRGSARPLSILATFENGYTVGDKVYFTGASETFKSGNRLEHGKQGEVVGPATCEKLKGKGVAVLFAGNKRMNDCCLTQARRLPPPTAPRCPS